MKRTISIIGLVVVVAAAGAAFALPHWAGGVAEEQHQAAWDAITEDPRLDVVSRDYSRGVRQSTARTELAISTGGTAKGGERLVFVEEDTIHHGPVIFGGESALGAARIESVVRPSEETAAAYPGLAGDEPLLTAETLVAFDGSSRIRYASPERQWQQDDVRMSFSGLSGTANLSAAMDRMDGDGVIDSFLVEGPDARAEITGVTIRSDARALSSWLWAGSTEMQINSIRIEEAGEAVAIDGVTLTASSDAEEGGLRGSMDLSAESVDTPQGLFSEGRLRVSSSNLDQAAIEQMVEWSQAMERGELTQQELNARLMNIWPDLLAANPRLAVDELHLETPDGSFSGSASAEWTAGRPNMNNPMTLINGLLIELRLSGPEERVGTLFSEMAGTGKAGQAGDRLSALEQQGLIVRQDGEVRTELALRESMVHANGSSMGSVWQFLRAL